MSYHIIVNKSGAITDKEILPVTRLNFGRTQFDISSGVHTLGRFQCSGQVTISGIAKSCEESFCWRCQHRGRPVQSTEPSNDIEIATRRWNLVTTWHYVATCWRTNPPPTAIASQISCSLWWLSPFYSFQRLDVGRGHFTLTLMYIHSRHSSQYLSWNYLKIKRIMKSKIGWRDLTFNY